MITQDLCKLYENIMAFKKNPMKPVILVPLRAIECAVENFDNKHLNLDDYKNIKGKDYISQKFALRLKKDFLSLYLCE